MKLLIKAFDLGTAKRTKKSLFLTCEQRDLRCNFGSHKLGSVGDFFLYLNSIPSTIYIYIISRRSSDLSSGRVVLSRRIVLSQRIAFYRRIFLPPLPVSLSVFELRCKHKTLVNHSHCDRKYMPRGRIFRYMFKLIAKSGTN